MNKIVAMTAYMRPHYLKQTLDALSSCVGINNYHLVISVDPAQDPVIRESIRDIVLRIGFCKCTRLFNQRKMGLNINTLTAIAEGFRFSDFVVYVEEDVLLGPDALAYFDYCGNKFQADKSVFSITAVFNKRCIQDEEYLKIDRQKWFTPWGVGLWLDRWHEIGPKESWGKIGKMSWDAYVNRNIRRDRHEIYPLLSRGKNIGVIGEHTPSQEFYNKYFLIQSWSGNDRWRNDAAKRSIEWGAL